MTTDAGGDSPARSVRADLAMVISHALRADGFSVTAELCYLVADAIIDRPGMLVEIIRTHPRAALIDADVS